MDEWFASLPDTLTVEHNGAQVPIKSHPFVQEAPDLGTFVKRAFDTHREVGGRIPIKVTDDASREAWRREHLPKLYQAGLLPQPADAPDKYFTPPAQLPPGVVWNETLVKSVGEILHKHGAPPALGGALAEIYTKQQEADLKTATDAMQRELDTVTTALKTKYGVKFDERMESARRLAKTVITDDPQRAEYDPDLLPIFMALGPLAEQDSSFVRDVVRTTSGAKSPEAAWQEHNDIIKNQANPKFKLYWEGDKDTIEYVNQLATTAFPGHRSL